MIEAKWLRGAIAVAFLFVPTAAFATGPYTSNNTGGGDWNNAATWSPNGIPTTSDSVTIVGSDTVTVTSAAFASNVTLQNASGSRTLRISTGGTLDISGAGTALQISGSTDGVNLVELDGGNLTLSTGAVNINAPSLSVARINFTSLGGILSVATDLTFSGTSTNAQVKFAAGSTGSVQLGGLLGAGGSITTGGSGSTFVFNGTSGQTINGYTFQNFTVNKSGVATLNAPITVNGNLNIAAGVLDDGGNQIALDGTGGSTVTIAGSGVLKLGSAAVGTNFPFPVNPGNVNFASGSAVVYQSGASQNIDTSFDYKRLFLKTLGGNVVRNFVNQTFLTVLEEFDVDTNVTASFDNDILEVDGDISGTGAIQLLNTVVPGSVIVRGDWDSTSALIAANGTSVTYDGTGPQNVLGATYQNLTINKLSGTATVTGNASVNGSLNMLAGNIVVGSSFFIDVLATVNHTSGYFIGPLTMGMNATPPRRFHVGTSAAYLPVDVDASSSGTVTVRAVEGAHPNRTGDNVLARYWRFESPSSVSSLDGITFNYNAADVVQGTEAKYNLAQYDLGTWTHYGDVVAEGAHTATVTSVALSYVGDWIIGQRGSVGLAGAVAITSVNGGSDPSINTPFTANVQSRYDNGAAANVTGNTTIDVLLNAGTGSLLTASGNIGAGTSTATISGLSYDTAESNVQLKAKATAGDPLDQGLSSFFNVVSTPSTLTVTNLNDTGAGSLRDAITTVNAGGCSSPCTIDFGVNGTGNIVLSSPLPALTANAANLTIDGFSAFGASANSAAFGSPSNAVITVSLDGNFGVAVGLEIQTSGVTIKGLAIRDFQVGPSGAAIKINGGANNVIAGCYLGTTNSGTSGSGNYSGIVITGAAAANNVIGGPSVDTLNVITSNTTWGIYITGGANNNEVKMNYIGVTATGANALANGSGGIYIDSGADFNKIGTGFVANVISGNAPKPGIEIHGSDNEVKNNRIGLNGAGAAALPNGTGVQLFGDDNYIGGIGSDRNFISGNSGSGIVINSSDNAVSNNYIGLDVAGTTAVPNGSHGILVTGTAAGNEIGEPLGNVIASNSKGILLNTTGIGNVMRRNAIRNNSLEAIDLGGDGPTANDATDSDSGAANNKQNYPTVSSAKINGANIDVTASIDSSGGVSVGGFLVEVFAADNSATPQAATYIGTSACLAGPAFTNAIISVPNAGLVTGNKIVVTATAFTDPSCTTVSEGTSELSGATALSGDIHWINSSGGSWETASNWSPATVPTSADTAYIDAGGTYSVTINSNVSVAGIHIGTASGAQTVIVNPADSLTIASASDLTGAGRLTLNGTSFGGTGTLSVSGTLNWNSGSISGIGALDIDAGATWNIGGAVSHSLSQRIVTIAPTATATWTSGDIVLSSSASILNNGTFDAQGNGNFANGGGGGNFTNGAGATFRKSTGTGTTTLSNFTLINNGTIDIQTGILDAATLTSSGPIQIAGTCGLALNSDVATFNAGSTVTGAGLVKITSAGILSVDGNLSISNLVLDSPGTLNGSGILTYGALLWNGGIMSGTGTTRGQSGSTLTIATVANKVLARPLDILGSATVTTTGTGTFFLSTGGSIANAGTWDVQADMTITNGGGGAFVNSNMFRKSLGSGPLTISNVAFNNTGTVDMLNGQLDLASGTNTGTFQLASGTEALINSDTYTFATGASVSGGGSLHLTGAGILTVSAPASVANFAQDAGTLDGTSILTISANGNWSGGIMQGSGTTLVGPAATLTFSGASSKFLLSRTLSIQSGGSANVTGNGTIQLQTGGNIANAGTFTISTDQTFSNGGGAGAFVNTGTLSKNTTTGTTLFNNVALTNSGGTIYVQTGIINTTSGGFTQSSGLLKFLLNGVTPGVQHGQFVISGGPTPSFAGTLQVLLQGVYQPVGGNAFRVISITGGAHTGDFTQPYTYPALTAGRTWSDAYDASGLLLTVSGQADLSIAKTGSGTVVAGAPLAYTLTVNNPGPDAASAVSVTDTLPAGHTSITASGTGWTCNVVTDTVTCTTASLNAGSAPAITINANAPSTPQTMTNVANVSSSNDGNGANNSASLPVTVSAGAADLDVSASSPAAPIAPATAFQFDFQVANVGPQTATNVTFTAPIPSTLSYTNATPSAGTCLFSASIVTCNLGSIVNGANAHVVLDLASGSTAGTHTVTGTANATEADPVPSNNSIAPAVQVTGGTVVVTNTNDVGSGSLRQALLDAQNFVCTSPCSITFNIPAPPYKITPLSDFVAIGSNVSLDARTQPGYAGTPIVEIDGSSLVASPATLLLNGTGAKVAGLSVTRANAASNGIALSGNLNTVEACFVGLTPLGATAANDVGIRVDGSNNTIGGNSATKRNIISNNTVAGIRFSSASANTVIGNYIGTDPTGSTARPNGVGVDITGNSDSNFIGGPTPGEINVISGNTTYGVHIGGASAGATADNNVITNSYIGPNAAGSANVQNLTAGVAVDDFSTSTLMTGNVISGNQNGIILNGTANSGTSILGNLIGIAPDGSTAMGNAQAGIVINGATLARIGTTTFGEGNQIANNGTNGVTVTGGAISNAILGNSIGNDTLLGIDLNADGGTLNDTGDGDTGPNGKQNFPNLTAATLDGSGGMTIAYNIDSSAAGAGSILAEFFKADASGEGKTFISRTCTVGNNFGAGTSFSAPPFMAAGDFVVATATSFTDTNCTTVADGTSEFSNSIAVTICTPPPATFTAPSSICSGTSTVAASVNAPTATSFNWTVTGGTLTSGQGTSAITFTPAASGNVVLSVTVSDATNCTNVASSTIPITAPPSVTITGPTATCSGTPVTLDAGAGFVTYLWSPGGQTTPTITVSPTGTQTYNVTVTDAGGCSGTDSHTVTVSSTPTATITSPAAVCQSSANNNAAVATQAGATYAWTITNGTITSSAAIPNITFTAGASGSVGLSVTITAGSCTSSGSVNIPINAAPVVTITGPTQSCPSTPFTLSATAGFSSYLWSNGATTQSISVTQNTASATYSVTASNGSCSATATHTVTLLAPPSAVISAPGSAAPDAAGLAASVVNDPLASYAWTISNGTITGGAGTSAITFTVGSSGSTFLTVTASKSGCTALGQHTVTITAPTNTQADLGVTKSAPATVQAGGTLVYTIGVTNAGPDAATDMLIVDTLPPGTTLASIDAAPWNCFTVGSTISCTGVAFPGESSTITVTVKAPQQAGAITNNVSISATIADPNPSNNSASATTNVLAGTTTCATVPPSLTAPADGVTVTSPVKFSWSSVAGATEYELWLVSANLTTLAGTTANTSLTLQLPSGPASWFVVARLGTGCAPLRSAQRAFSVSDAANCATHGAPQLTTPFANTTVASPATFSWSPVPQAIGYRLWIQLDGTAAQDLGTTNGAISLTTAVPPGAIVAFVDALFSGCPATRSPAIAFTVSRPDRCADRTAASPFAPANDATLGSSSVDFHWNAAGGDVAGYRLWYSVDGATPAVLGNTTSETSLHATLAPGTIVWWLESLYEGCASTESARFRFTIPQRANCSTAAPAPVAPQNGSTAANGEVTFTWTSVQSAVGYELWVAAAKGSPILLGTTSATSLTHTLSPGDYDWFVRVGLDRCPPRDSEPSHFSIQPPANCADRHRAIAIAPIEGAQIVAPVDFTWTAPAGATSFELFAIRGNAPPQLLASTTAAHSGGVNLAAGTLRWFVRTHFNGCAALDSEERELEIVPDAAACAPLDAPVIDAPGQISSGVPFLIQWTPIAGATAYQLQLSGAASFASAETITTTATQHELTRTTTVFARVRAIDGRCQPSPTLSAYGPTAAIFILPSQGSEGAAPLTGGNVTFTIPIPAQFAGQTFTATTHDLWLTVAPASGIVAAGGTNLAATANTSTLPVGASLGAVTITLNTTSSTNVQTNGTSLYVPTVSISLVTPVTPSPKSGPPPDALIIPAVAHAGGINSQFQSDVRVSNTSPQLLKYQLTFTPSGGAGIGAGKQTTFSIEPGRTVVLDDVLKSWFGTGGDSVIGTLEIRPLTQTTTSTSGAAVAGLANLVTFAASRTFNLTANGTFGQYIPAIPYANFVGRALDLSKPNILSLQQIAQSDRYRTNLGILEGSGEPASLLVKVFGDTGQKLTEFPVNLAGGEHTQLNAFLAQHGVNSLTDGRVEIEVLSSAGKVTAYASVLDNQTSDPLLVTPVTLTDAGATRWVVPGVADLNNGFANWQTDMRVFNAGTTPVDATLSFYSQGGGAAKTKNVTVPAGQVLQFDKTLASVFGVTNDGGAVHITTANAARLITTARTYNQTTAGTYGQFISAVTPAEAAGVGSRPLQILQIEESTRFRSNIGLAEVTGKPVTIEISVVPPDVKFTAVTQLTLQANEFRQIGSLLKTVGLDGTFNARVSIRAINGQGRVTAYASVIDAQTNDPTYVPAQ
jgi:uncharacterized repeat protein (TIGR01451 family)